MALDPSVAAVRSAVRRLLTGLADDPGCPVLVACSGGADSLALLAAAVFETRRTPRRVIGVTVDHGLQHGSAERADRVVAQMAALGVDETVSARVQVQGSGQGLEAAAREARYAVLEEVAERMGSSVVLLGHTLDDQAETVLLGLARGSGGRSIAGMRRDFPPFHRPLLDLTRARTEAACAAEGIDFWCDPHNEDPRFTRSRVRHRVMPVLEEELGPGVAATLARTADQLQEDLRALDHLAEAALDEAQTPSGLAVTVLSGQEDAVRTRVLRTAALRAGCPPAELFRSHVLAVDGLVTQWRGQRWIDLPGHVQAYRADGEIRFRRATDSDGRGAVAG